MTVTVKQLQTSEERFSDSEKETESSVFHYTPWQYLRTMWLIAWSAFRHPFSTTVINVETGEFHHRKHKEES